MENIIDIRDHLNEVNDNVENENQVNPGVTFGVLLGKARAYVKGEITSEELGEWGNTLTVITSLPLAVKTAILLTLSTKIFLNSDSLPEIIASNLEKEKFFLVYLRYLGVENLMEEECTYENYDIMEPLYGPWIELIAKRDIAKFTEMLQNYLSISFSHILSGSLEGLDELSMQQTSENNKEFLQQLIENKDIVRTLGDIMAFNNPILTEGIPQVQDSTLK